jgi:hypothetical protein
MFKFVISTGCVLAALVGFSGVVAGAGSQAKAALESEPGVAMAPMFVEGYDGPFGSKHDALLDAKQRQLQGYYAYVIEDPERAGSWWVHYSR